MDGAQAREAMADVRVVWIHPTAAADTSLFNHLAAQPGIRLRVFLSYPDRSGRGPASDLTAEHIFLPASFVSPPGRGGTALAWNPGLEGLLEGERPEALLVGGYGNVAGGRAIMWALRHGVPWVLFSETWRHGSRMRRRLKHAVLGPVLRRAAGFVVYGARGEAYLRALGGRAPAVRIGSNRDLVAIARATATRSREDGARNDPIRFVYVGRLSPEKGVEVLLGAFARVHAARPSVHLLIAGDGPLRPVVLNCIRRGLPVRWLGPVPHAEVPQVLSQGSVLVLPSLQEPWGMVVPEGMAAGLPVIATDAVGSTELFVRPGETGWIVPPRSTGALAAAMLEASSADLAAMGGRARSLALRYDVRPAATMVADLLRQAARGAQ